MTTQEFFNKWNGKLLDFDGAYGGQCVDVYRQYCREVLDFPQSPPVIGAADIWTTYLKDKFDKIKNTPDGVPELGDIIIWNKYAGGGFGHVGIFSEGGVNSFISFDENWPSGSVCHFQPHNYTNVLGWLRAKVAQTTPEPINNQTKIPQITDENGNPMEVQQIKSLLNDRLRDLKSCQESIEGRVNEAVEKEKAAQQKTCNERVKEAINTAKAEEKAIWQPKVESANQNLKDLKLEYEKMVFKKAEKLSVFTLFRLALKKMVRLGK